MRHGQKGSLDVIVNEILSSYNHRNGDQLDYGEMFSLVKEIMPEIDPYCETLGGFTDDHIHTVIQRFDDDGSRTFDRAEVQNFLKIMLEYGWEDGQERV